MTEGEDEDEVAINKYVTPDLFLQVEIDIAKNGMKAKGVGNFKMDDSGNYFSQYAAFEENYINIIHTN